MIPLAPKFRTKGFDWRIVQREGDIAIVEQNKEGWTEPVLNVVIVQKIKGGPMPRGRVSEDHESLPGWEDWGESAWTCHSREDAKRRFNALVDQHQSADSSIPPTPKVVSGSSFRPATKDGEPSKRQ